MKNPKTMSDAELLETYKLYKDLQSTGVRDEIYISMLENEIDALDVAYAAAAEHDAKMQANVPMPDEWEDPSDYVGMGWVDSRGRP